MVGPVTGWGFHGPARAEQGHHAKCRVRALQQSTRKPHGVCFGAWHVATNSQVLRGGRPCARFVGPSASRRGSLANAGGPGGGGAAPQYCGPSPLTCRADFAEGLLDGEAEVTVDRLAVRA